MSNQIWKGKYETKITCKVLVLRLLVRYLLWNSLHEASKFTLTSWQTLYDGTLALMKLIEGMEEKMAVVTLKSNLILFDKCRITIALHSASAFFFFFFYPEVKSQTDLSLFHLCLMQTCSNLLLLAFVSREFPFTSLSSSDIFKIYSSICWSISLQTDGSETCTKVSFT